MTQNKETPLFNAGAAVYDSFTFLRGPAELTAERARLYQGQRVLDAACGSGWAAKAAAEKVGETGHVTGIDIADKLIDIARAKAVSAGRRNIEYRVCDAVSTDFEDGTFDVVLCASSVFLFADIPGALREFNRVLKDGGRTVFSMFGRDTFQPVTGMIEKRLAGYEDIRFPEPVTSVTDTPEKCRAIVEAAGFGDPEITQEIIPLYFQDREECWRQVSGSLLVRPRLRKLPPEKLEEMKAGILPELDEMKTEQGIPVEIHVLFCTLNKL